MKNNNNTEEKGKYLTEKQRLKKEKMLLQLRKEIKTLEFDITHQRLTNAKIEAIKNLKIGARTLQLIAPYVLTASITAGGSALLGDIPFYGGDEFEVYANVMTEFDEDGNVRYERQYDLNGSQSINDKVSYYAKWEQDEDGLYSRTIKMYSVEKKTYEEIIELIDKENLRLEDIFGEPYFITVETKDNITEEELQKEAYFRIILYDKDKNDYIIREETASENIILSAVYIAATMFGMVLAALIRERISSFDYKYCVNRIKKSYPLVDVLELSKKLEIKRDNYNRLTR